MLKNHRSGSPHALVSECARDTPKGDQVKLRENGEEYRTIIAGERGFTQQWDGGHRMSQGQEGAQESRRVVLPTESQGGNGNLCRDIFQQRLSRGDQELRINAMDFQGRREGAG